MMGQGESKKTEGRIAATGKLRRVLDLRKSGVGFQLVKATGHSQRLKAETPESLIAGFVDSAEVCAAKKATSKIAAIT
jgi:hypothetical protein